MTGLGLIGTGAALLNYRRAKAEYEALQEQHDGLMAAVEAYQVARDGILSENVELIDAKPNDRPDGVEISSILRVANLVGNMYYAKGSIILSNQSSNSYHIYNMALDCFLNKTALYGAQKIVDSELPSGQMVEYQFERVLSAIETAQIRDIICKAAGKQLITSCPKINVYNIIKSDILISWANKRKDYNEKKAYIIGQPAVLRYCKELSLLNE